MIAELISVGTELLLGDIVNTNAAYLARECAALGLSVYYQTTVGDNAQRLKNAIVTAKERADVIILGGGLGPTEDDLTKETAAEVFGRRLVEDARSRERIEDYFRKLDRDIVTANNWKQAVVPEGSIVVDNDNGTAPGIIMEAEGKIVILLPGPPNEMIPMFEKSIAPYLREKQPERIESVTLKLCGIGESRAETELLDLIDAQTNPTIATYAKTGEVHVRLTAKANTTAEARKLIAPVAEEIKHRLGEFLYTAEEEVTLEETVVSLLKERKMILTTAESCTGGLLSGRLINIAGASDVFHQGLVTYANEAKQALLSVREETLAAHGAVSSETALEMAEGARKASGADIAVAVTGVAGPGCSEKKPAGLVYIACSIRGKLTVRRFQFSGNRQKVRDYAVTSALTLVWQSMMDYEINDGRFL